MSFRIKSFAYYGALVVVWCVIGLTGLLAWYAHDLPDPETAFTAHRRPSITIVAGDGSPLFRVGDRHAGPVVLSELPDHLPAAVLATEDRRFRTHFGIDPIAVVRALMVNVRAGRIRQGGSTITQQVAKTLFLTPERTLRRKVRELLLALWLEWRFTKDQILSIYLNRVYLGAGAYGVEAAARTYFGRSARSLGLYESAMLAGLLKAPSRDNPFRDAERAHRRTVRVLAGMVDAGYLSEAEARAARVRRRPASQKPAATIGRHFADWVVEQVPAFVAGGDRDLRVITTLDPRLQRLAESLLARAMATWSEGVRDGEAALVVMTPDGAVKAMVGGRDYGRSPFNRATQAFRQPGSAFKPVVFLAGLESGLVPGDRFTDEPIRVGDWSPRNFSRRYRGEVTVRQALAQSINSVAVRVGQRAGFGRIVEVARRLGFTGRLEPRPSLALGAGEVSLIELTAAYAVFANGGRGVWPHGIEEIRDASGQVLYRRVGSGPGRVVGRDHAAVMNAMLADVIVMGTGRAARLSRPVAGKTGTSQNFRDAWFVGYSAQLVAGVWVGNDDGRPMNQVTGGGLPAKIWRDVMATAHAGLPPLALFGTERAASRGRSPGFWRDLLSRLRVGDG